MLLLLCAECLIGSALVYPADFYTLGDATRKLGTYPTSIVLE
jgi:hypothetical protein